MVSLKFLRDFKNVFRVSLKNDERLINLLYPGSELRNFFCWNFNAEILSNFRLQSLRFCHFGKVRPYTKITFLISKRKGVMWGATIFQLQNGKKVPAKCFITLAPNVWNNLPKENVIAFCRVSFLIKLHYVRSFVGWFALLLLTANGERKKAHIKCCLEGVHKKINRLCMHCLNIPPIDEKPNIVLLQSVISTGCFIRNSIDVFC